MVRRTEWTDGRRNGTEWSGQWGGESRNGAWGNWDNWETREPGHRGNREWGMGNGRYV